MSEDNADFKKYGEVASLTAKEADPVLSCLATTKFIADPTNPLRYQVGLCETWMAQRCARGWDKYCDIYLADRQNDDFTGKRSNEWLRQALEAKFCRLDANAPGSYCYQKCDLVDPIGTSGAQVCRTMGDVVYRDSNKLYNLDTNYNWSNTLTAPSPIKFKPCEKVCDVFTLADFDEDDRILNECLDRGVGLDILQNVAQNIVSNNVPIRNSRLRKFIERYVIGTGDAKSITPGFSSVGQAPMVVNRPIATPAVNPYIPPRSAIAVSNVGNMASQPISQEVAPRPTDRMENLRFQRQGASSKSSFGRPTIRTRQESFGFLPSGSDSTPTYIIIAILVIAVIMILRGECKKK